MKKSNFKHLFSTKSQRRELKNHLPDKNAKRFALALFILFFFLYIQVKPYSGQAHHVEGVMEYLFMLYQFVINQTLGIVHEGGHGVCYILPCPQFVMVLNGTLFQWLFPLSIGVYYKRRGNQMAFYAGLFILGISMDYTSWYMSTAHEGLHLPAYKSFLGVDALHDFNYLFTSLGLMQYESLISGMTKLFAFLLMIGSLIAMFFEAFSNKKNREE